MIPFFKLTNNSHLRTAVDKGVSGFGRLGVALVLAALLSALLVSLAQAQTGAPADPNLSAGKVTDTSIELTWRAEPNDVLRHMEIEINGSWEDVHAGIPGPSASHTKSGLRPGTTYKFRVTACRLVNGQAVCSSRAEITVETTGTIEVSTRTTLPEYPALAFFEVHPDGSNIKVQWHHRAGVNYYVVHRSTDQSNWETIRQHGTHNTKIDKNVVCATDYWYRGAGLGDNVNYLGELGPWVSAGPIKILCDPIKVKGFSVSRSGDTFSFSWDRANYTAKYRVRGRSGISGWVNVVDDTTRTSGTYTPHDGVHCGTGHTFLVQSRGDGIVTAERWGGDSDREDVTTEACNQHPVFGADPYAFSIAENSANGTAVGTVSATDDDTTDTVTYSITAGNGDSKFAISSTSGAITVAGALNYENLASYSLTVQASDGRGGRDTATVNVTVTNVPEGKPAIPSGLDVSLSSGTFSISWNTVTGADEYQVQYRLGSSGNWTSLDAVTTTSTAHTPATPVVCDTIYEFQVRAHGDNNIHLAHWSDYSATERETVTAPCNQLPVFGDDPYAFSVAENSANGTAVGTVSATDGNTSDTVAYSITAGNGDSKFAISSTSGAITVAGSLDFEALASYSLTVQASDGRGGSDITTVNITVTNVPEGKPAIPSGLDVSLSSGTFSISWNSVTGADEYQAQYRLGSSGDWTPLDAVATTSTAHTPATPVVCDAIYEFQVRAHGDNNIHVAEWSDYSATESETVTAPCNYLPVFGDDPYAFSVAENSASDAAVGTVSATDGNTSDTVAYSITAGNGDSKFAISSTSGAITVAGSLDFEALASYSLTVQASDGRGGNDTATVNITVTNVPEGKPAIPSGLDVSLSSGTFSISWNTVTGADEYQAQYRLGSSGDWTSLDAVTTTSTSHTPATPVVCDAIYEFQVRAHGDNNIHVAEWSDYSATESETVTAPCNYLPVFGDDPYAFSVAENSANGTAVGTVSATDGNSSDTVAYSITAGNGDSKFAISSSGAITVAGSLDFEALASYSLTVQASDGRGGSDITTVNISVSEAKCANGTTVPDHANNPDLVSDCKILLGIKDTLAGSATLNWGPTVAVSSWDGVTVADTPSRVTRLELDREQLTGSIPSAFGSLSALRRLNLANNQLSGTIPDELGNLSNLTRLELNRNSLSGSIPEQLGNLSNLIRLSLARNNLTGSIPEELEGLTNLQQINLAQNTGLTGCIPSALRDVSSNDLDLLGLLYCDNVAATPDNLSVSLTAGTFSLSWDAVSGASKYRVQFHTGDESWIIAGQEKTTANMTFSPNGGPACGTTYSFQVQAYGDGTIHVALWSIASEPASVATEACTIDPVFGQDPYSFTISDGAAVDAAVGTVSATDEDTTDTISYSITEGNADGKFAISRTSGAITVASVLDYETTPSYSLTVKASDGRGGTATAMVTVSLFKADCVNGTTVPNHATNSDLVSDCGILLGAKDTLAGTATLNWGPTVAITSWDGVRVAGSPSRVTRLELDREGLTGSVPSTLGGLSALRRLNLANNQLTGTIPGELGNLSYLARLSLNKNSLSGSIPERLGNLSNLIRLSLARNNLVGSIPEELGNLSNLVELWLARNNLTGAIPEELGGLTSLQQITLAHNTGLTGCIPAGLRDVRNNDLNQLGLLYCDNVASAPGNLSVSLTAGTFSLSWDAVTGATKYRIQFHTGDDNWTDAGPETTTTNSTFVPAGGTVCGTTYTLQVQAYGDGTTHVADWGTASDPEPFTTEACN